MSTIRRKLVTIIIGVFAVVLGVLFVIVLRRTLVAEADLPFPESMAAAEIVKAGQGGQTGAKYVFGSMGLAGLWEVFVNPRGLTLIGDSASRFFEFPKSQIEIVLLEGTHEAGISALQGEGFRVTTHGGALEGEALIEEIRRAHVVGIRSKTQLTRDVLERCERLRLGPDDPGSKTARYEAARDLHDVAIAFGHDQPDA